MIANDFRKWLESIEGFPPTHYQHAAEAPGKRFAWFIFSGSTLSAETLNIGEPPDTYYVDLEIYDNDLDDLQETLDALLARADYRGTFGDGWIEDVLFEDQRDDYTPQADSDSIPSYFTFYRVTLTGYRA